MRLNCIEDFSQPRILRNNTLAMLRTTRGVTVTIDGPVGVGKSTIAKEVALRLSYTLVDTGCIYRAIARLALDQDIDWDDEAGLLSIVDNIHIAFAFNGDLNRVFCNGSDITERIQSREISEGATFVSQLESVRTALLSLQRKLATRGGAVLEGRAVGTVVFPEADVKVYLDAPLDVRAQRRLSVLQKRVPELTLDDARRNVEERDQQDQAVVGTGREHGPDIMVIDTSGREVSEIVEQIVIKAGAQAMKRQREALKSASS